MNITEATKRACQEPTLLDALSWICVWESERVVDQATNRRGSRANGAGWDTCFRLCLESVLRDYDRTPGPEWIDIKKRHPKVGQKVLVFEQYYNKAGRHISNYYVAVFIRKPQDQRTFAFVDQTGRYVDQLQEGNGRGVWQYTDVTHWMPLPDTEGGKVR